MRGREIRAESKAVRRVAFQLLLPDAIATHDSNQSKKVMCLQQREIVVMQATSTLIILLLG